MQGRPFLMPSPPGWGWAPISTSLLTLGVAASTLQKPSQRETRAAAWGLGQQARAVQGARSPLCQEMHDGGGDASSSALHLLGLIFISVHGQPTLLLFVGPWLLFFCSLLPWFPQLLPLNGLGRSHWPSPGAEMAKTPQDINRVSL